jgi:hypothetical protein
MAIATRFDPLAFQLRFKDERKRSDLTYQQVSDGVTNATCGARGSSYGSVYSYEQDAPNPPRENIVRALADLFGVEFKWLMWGEDPRTKGRASEEAIGGEATANAEALVDPWTKNLSETIDEAAGTDVPGVAHAVIAHHWRRLHEIASYSGRTRRPAADTLSCLLEAVLAPLQTAGANVAQMGKDELAAYLMGVVPAVARALEDQIRQRVRAEIDHRLTKR